MGINNLIDPTYIMDNKNIDEIISLHQKLHDKYNIPIKNSDLTLPILYAIPKLHKTPYKFRFIAGAHNSSLKPMSILLLNCLKKIQEHFKAYCKKIEYSTHKKLYIAINNSTEVTDFMGRKKIKPRTGTSYDFSTLYTKLDHKIIQKNLFYIIELLFKDNRQYLDIPITKYGTTKYSSSYVKHCNKICLAKKRN